MSKIGVEVQIDVTKIDKARLYKGQKGTYLTMTTFIDLDQLDQYGNNGFIAHKKGQDEQQNAPILGNVKVFWNGERQTSKPQKQESYQQPQQPPKFGGANSVNPMAGGDFDDDIPFMRLCAHRMAHLAI